MKRRKDSRVFLTVVLALCHIGILNAFNLNTDTVQIALDFETNPSSEIQLNSSTTDTEFEIIIDGSAWPPMINEVWKISLVVEEMNAGPDLNCSSVTGPHIKLNYDYGAKKISVCHNFDDTKSNFQAATYFSGNHTNIKIATTGNWNAVTAQIVVTIYYETTDCSLCQGGTFCCDGKNTCKGSVQSDDSLIVGVQVEDTKPRCIAGILKCNDHANCGMACNADESKDACLDRDECHSLPSGCYWEAGFFWTAVLAVVFFVMAPTVIVFLICYHKQVNTLNARRRGGPVTVSSPPNDLPPTYDELAEDDPPPCFCSVMSARPGSDAQDGGVDNIAYEPEARPGHQSFTCVCRGSKPADNDGRANT